MAIFFVTPIDDVSMGDHYPGNVSHEGYDMSRGRTFKHAQGGAPGDASTGSAGLAGGDLSSSLLIQMKDAIARIETELAHLTKVAEATRKDVDDLKTWKALVLGGAAVLGLLFGLYKTMAGTVHVGLGTASPAAVAPYVAAPSPPGDFAARSA
jgi:hypothetical protein